MERAGKRAFLLAFALGVWLSFLLAIYWQLQPTDSGSADTGIYLSGAESLAEGCGYRFIAYAGEPSITLYPPMQAAYLSIFWRLNPSFPNNIPALFAGMVLLALAVVASLSVYWSREGMKWPSIALLIVTWSLSPLWCWQLGTLLSDILFGAWWLGVAWIWKDARSWDKPSLWFATGALVALMYLTRTAALAPLTALGALVIWRALKGQWRGAVAYLVPTAAAFLFWKMFSADNITYADIFRSRIIEEGGWGGMMVYWAKQFIDYASGAYFLRGLFPWAMGLTGTLGLPSWGLNTLTAFLMVCGWLFMALWIWGWSRSRSKGHLLLGAMVFAFLAEHVIWPFDIGEKAVFSVLPFVLLWASRGATALIEARPTLYWTRWSIAAFIVITALGNISMLPAKSVEWNQHNHLSELTEVATWARQHTPTNALVAVSWEHPVLHFYHYSHRKVVQDQFDKLWERIVRPPSKAEDLPEYLLCSRHKPLTKALPPGLCAEMVKQSQGAFYTFYRLKQSAAPSAAE